MTDRPILFSAPMIRALLSGAKTQTRRAVKGAALGWLQPGMFDPVFVASPENHLCPYGVPGDRLYCRETWAPLTTGYAYRADECWQAPPADRWRPSIHMPRRASRILLEVTEVRVERLRDISEADAIAEGIEYLPRLEGYGLPDGSHFHCADQRISYWSLWETINGPGSVESNPYVWAVSFKTVEGA